MGLNVEEVLELPSLEGSLASINIQKEDLRAAEANSKRTLAIAVLKSIFVS